MIVALFALALAMLIGGIAAIVQGAPFVRLELGWTMVISGSVVMSGGAILAGVAAAVWRLRRIELEIVEARETAARPVTVPSPPSPLPPPVPADAPPTFVPEARREPVLAAPPVEVRPEGLAPDERAVLAAGDLMPPLSARRDEEPAREEAPAAFEPRIEPVPPPPAEPVAAPEPPPEPEVPAPASEEPPPRVVVGTYASGGNTYVMYSDGSIEADTPNGKYTFNSLEELKVFASTEGAAAPAKENA